MNDEQRYQDGLAKIAVRYRFRLRDTHETRSAYVASLANHVEWLGFPHEAMDIRSGMAWAWESSTVL